MHSRLLTGAPRFIFTAGLLFVLACTHFENWQLVRQRPPETVTTRVKVITTPEEANIFVNGRYMGQSPLEIDMRYKMAARIYGRRQALPYPHTEEKEVPEYTANDFTFKAVATGHEVHEQQVQLRGQENIELRFTLFEKAER